MIEWATKEEIEEIWLTLNRNGFITETMKQETVIAIIITVLIMFVVGWVTVNLPPEAEYIQLEE